MPTFRERVAQFILGDNIKSLSTVTAKVDDSPGWTSLSGRPHDLTSSEIHEQYEDALKAWRKNPLAFRIISITSDYIVGDEVVVSSPNKALTKFTSAFWNHPKNRMDLRLEPMCDELSRAGDVFVLLFRIASNQLNLLRMIGKLSLSIMRYRIKVNPKPGYLHPILMLLHLKPSCYIIRSTVLLVQPWVKVILIQSHPG